ncbi:MAG TPA: hypothetical protein VGN63_07770 [Flavisolibacter sp.]|jgi:hypothetical protein|nr:hypothetical protein [Flavisolibacter sp.]
MRRSLYLFVLTLLAFSCSKSNDNPDNTTQPVPEITVDNTWRCEIGGKLYQGSIDTSFITLQGEPGRTDTIVTLSGSTADGSANIALKMMINRFARRSDTAYLGISGNYLTFDTASTSYLKTSEGTVWVPFKIEAFRNNKLKGSFSGNLASVSGPTQSITNGAISVELGKGNGAPKMLRVNTDGQITTGPIRSAVLQSNALIIDGFAFDGVAVYQLQVRTGATIKPGTYKSTNGDVGFYIWRPSIITHNVSDVQGDLSVTIQSVEGGIVTGTFSGQSLSVGTGITAVNTTGQFKCRVKDYVAGMDAKDQWQFNIDGPFMTAGGDITNATINQINGRYVLSLNGTSDKGNSTFRLRMASFQPFAPGTYELSSWTDSCYFSTPSVKYFNANDKAYVRIDSLSTTRIVGRFYGDFAKSGLLYGGGLIVPLRKGSFRTDGQF